MDPRSRAPSEEAPPRPVPWDQHAGALPAPDLRAKLLAAARAKPASTTRERAGRRWRLALGAALPAVALFGALGVGPKGRPLALTVLMVVGWALVACAATTLAFWGRSPLGPSRPALGLLGAAAPLSALAVSAIGMLFFPDTWSGAVTSSTHTACMVLGGALGAAPLGAMLLYFQGSDPVAPGLRGAGFGAVSGAWGGAGMMMLCPHHTFAHVAIGHVLPMALFALAGAGLGAALLRVRPRPA
ncbi:MAG: DUF1109 family protein [Myxococcales bacterium]|jgi:hypothetical protein|nr:DUF1109 family protein [Myxococcales bacterium]MBL0196314.1 DUF1109 family protein [Myxococcales bacterium]HQY61304.1 NrsF family protein [Polyangiaceae bacterium]